MRLYDSCLYGGPRFGFMEAYIEDKLSANFRVEFWPNVDKSSLQGCL